MNENAYIQDILNVLGLAINEKNNSEITVNFPINFNKKNMKFKIENDYKVSIQPLGTFLSDFLNCDFTNDTDFFTFFIKYSTAIVEYSNLKSKFTNGYCDKDEFYKFFKIIYDKNKDKFIKLQEQVDMVLDYCLISPNKRALEFTPIQRFYVLKEFSPGLSILENRITSSINFILFSSYPGDTEEDIYKFLKCKNSFIENLDLTIPNNISDIIYKSLIAILSENVYLKTCKNCGKYFIAKAKNSDYCRNIVEGTNKTCQDIGRSNVFKKSKENDPILSLYYKVYNRKASMK